MLEHYQILPEHGGFLDIAEMYMARGDFNNCGGLLGLMHHHDNKGHIKTDICEAIFESLSTKDKLSVLRYPEWEECECEEIEEAETEDDPWS